MSIYRTNNPMQYAQVDGIVIDEKAPPPNIKGVGTGVAIIVGQFNQGPKNKITEPGSYDALTATFGKDSPGHNALINKRFSRLKVIRVNQVDAVNASHTFQASGNDIIEFVAIAPGVAGNAITVAISTAVSGKTYTIVSGSTTETFTGTIDAIANAINTGNDKSTLVTARVISTANEPTNATATNLTGGVNKAVTDADYTNAIDVAAAENAGNILFLDEYTEARNTKLLAHATETEDKMVICGGPLNETITQAATAVATLRDTAGRVIYAYNWVQTLVNNVKTFVHPAPFIASIISNTSAHVDPAAVSNGQFLYGVTAINQDITRAGYIQLLNAGVCAFEYDPDIGFKLKSGIVTQIADISKVTILRRRMADYLTNSIGRFLKLYQNEPNTAENRRAVKSAILSFIEGQEQLGILPKDSEVQGGTAKIVDIDSLNTDQSLAEGRFVINYRQRIYSSMRFIVLIAEIGQSVVVTEGE